MTTTQKPKTTKILMMVIALMLSLSLTACGSKSPSSIEYSTIQESTVEETTQEPTTEEQTEPTTKQPKIDFSSVGFRNDPDNVMETLIKFERYNFSCFEPFIYVLDRSGRIDFEDVYVDTARFDYCKSHDKEMYCQDTLSISKGGRKKFFNTPSKIPELIINGNDTLYFGNSSYGENSIRIKERVNTELGYAFFKISFIDDIGRGMKNNGKEISGWYIPECVIDWSKPRDKFEEKDENGKKVIYTKLYIKQEFV